MVKLEEVLDEEFQRAQAGPDAEDDWDTDSESEVSSDDEELGPDESFADRIYALKDIVPPQQRRFLSSSLSTASSWLQTGFSFSGKTLWVVSTSALLLGVPWALAFAEEQQMQEMEREMKMQQSANELLTQGAGQPQGAKPAL
ncbi:mitochondrial import receptor subunit Tom22 [Zalaria obscura]|uniref:Mitochondrial import receptor subunit Tom22 n=1 Tax=Zalaria obscura TaxID=2024903 RepID=A0ACC3SP73_9PEZI